MNDFTAELRRAARQLLPEGAFLRRDRGEALYVTDAPRRAPSIDWSAAGFICLEAKGLAHLTPDESWLDRLEALYPNPPDTLCQSFRCFTGIPDAEALRLFARGMKALDAQSCDLQFSRALRQRAAVCLREHLPGGGLYACALALYLMEKERES